MRIKKKWQGRSAHRYQDNPLERVFAEEWQRENDRPMGGGVLDYLAVETQPSGLRPPVATDEQRLLSCTIIQWLGSPVGQNFLADVLSTPAGRNFLLHQLKVKLPGVR